MGKILFFDVDGTLVPFRKTIAPETAAALQEAREKGHQVVICTGRSLYMMEESLLAMADGIVATSGSYVRCGDHLVYQEYMPREIFLRAAEVLDRAGAILIGQAEGECRYRPRDACRLQAYFEAAGAPETTRSVFFGGCVISEDPADFAVIKKITYRESKWSVAELQEALRDCCDVVSSSFNPDSTEGEITCRCINKATGMQHYIDYLGKRREDTIAFGDSYNDREMLEFAGVGVAMGNAVEPLKKIADFVTSNVEDNGIAAALRTLGLIGNIAKIPI